MRITLNTKILRKFLGINNESCPDDVSSDKMQIVQVARTQFDIILKHGRPGMNIQPCNTQTRNIFNQH